MIINLQTFSGDKLEDQGVILDEPVSKEMFDKAVSYLAEFRWEKLNGL